MHTRFNNNQSGILNIGGTVAGSAVQTTSGTPPAPPCVHPDTEIVKANPGLKESLKKPSTPAKTAGKDKKKVKKNNESTYAVSLSDEGGEGSAKAESSEVVISEVVIKCM